jgi:hypothetical protein
MTTSPGRPVQCCTLCPEVAKFAHRRLPLDTVLDFAALSQSQLLRTLTAHGHHDTATQYGAPPAPPDQLTLNLGDTP